MNRMKAALFLVGLVAVILGGAIVMDSFAQFRQQVECMQVIGSTGDLTSNFVVLSYDQSNDALFIEYGTPPDCAYNAGDGDILVGTGTIAHFTCSTDGNVMYYDTATGELICEDALNYDDSSNNLVVGTVHVAGSGAPARSLEITDNQQYKMRVTSSVIPTNNCEFGELSGSGYFQCSGSDITFADRLVVSTPGTPQLRLLRTPEQVDFDLDGGGDLDIDASGDDVNFSDPVHFGTIADANAQVEVTQTTTQLRLSYDGSNYNDFTVSSAGDLTLDPTGSDIILNDGILKSATAATADTLTITSDTARTTGDILSIKDTTNERVSVNKSGEISWPGASDTQILRIDRADYGNPASYIKYLNTSNTIQVYSFGIDLVGNDGVGGTSTFGDINFGASSKVDFSAFDVGWQAAVTNWPADATFTCGTGDQGTGQITKTITNLTSCGANDDATLPAGTGPAIFWISNSSGNTIELWPPSGGTLSGLGVDTKITVPDSNLTKCVAKDSNDFFCITVAWDAA